MAGGPAGHGGNRYHYLYAARYLVDLLDPNLDVSSVWLEGYPGASDDDILDVAIEKGTTLRVVQVKWSLDGTMHSSEAYKIFSRLWSNKSIADRTVGSASLIIATNRNIAPELKAELEVASQWAELDSVDLASILADPDIGQTESRLKLGLIKITNGLDNPATLLEAAKRIHVDYLDSIESVAELVTAKLRALGLPASRITDVTDLAQRYCIGELAATRITADIVVKELGLSSRLRLRHDISRTTHYVEWPDLGQHLDPLVSQLTLSGGTIVVLGSPGVGKSTQLHEWSTYRNAAFYACRIDDHISDIPLRARIETFFSELPRLIRRRYPDRVPESPNYSVESSVPELVGRLNNLLDALGSSSPGTPGLVVIDGIDDVVRSTQNGAENFLSFLPEPPPGVVYVISSQGAEFLPMWAARTATNVEYVEFPSAPVELLMRVAEKVLTDALVENQSSLEPSELEPISARSAEASSGNLLLLRTLCGELLSKDPSEWAAYSKKFGTYDDIFDYYNRNLIGASPTARKLLKYLALARIPLTHELIVDVMSEVSEVVRDALRETDHLLIKSSHRAITTYAPHHPALRYYSDQHYLIGENPDIHSQFADAYLDHSEDPHYAIQQAHHLVNSNRQSEIVALVTYEFVDRLFESVANPGLIKEQVNLLATALPDDCEPKLAVFANLLASKIDARVQHLQSLSTFNSDAEIERFVDFLEVIIRTRPSTDGIISAIDQLDAVDDPEGRFQIAIRLALRLFKSHISEGAIRIFEVARNTAFVHDAGKDIMSLANNLACQIWNDEPVDQVLTRAMSTKWSRTQRDAETEEIPEHEQNQLNSQVVEIVAAEAMRAGRAEELRSAIAEGPEKYRPAALLGATRVGGYDWYPAEDLVATQSFEAHISADQNLQIATIICRHKGSPEIAEEMQNPSKDFHVPDLLGGGLPEGRAKIKSFLVDLEFRLRIEADTTPQFQIFGDSRSDRDQKKGCELYFTAAKTSFEFRIASEDGVPIEQLYELGSVCLAIWETLRPDGMGFSPFLDAKHQIEDLTPGLLVSAFKANPDLGTHIGDQILSLPRGAVGALRPDDLLQTLMHLGEIPEARPWVVRTLIQCVDQFAEIRSTQERIDILIKAAKVFLQSDLLVDSQRMLVEALKCTKGIPYGDEEPRYYAAQTLIDRAREFGIDVTDPVYKMGQLIEDSFDVTGRAYAGNTWPWLVESFARIDLARSLNLALELDSEQDSDALEIQESLLNVCVGSIETLDPVSWASLAWIANWKNGSNDTRKNHTLNTVLERCDSDKQRANLSRWLTPIDEGFERRSDSGVDEFRDDPARTPDIFKSENANAAISGDSIAAEIVLDDLEQLISSDASIADDFRYNLGLRNWLLSVSKVTDKNLLQRIMEVSQRFGALGSYRAELLVAIAERLKDEAERATKLLLNALDESIWYEGSQASEALKLLHEIDPALARQQLIQRIHSRRGTSSPYFLAKVLAALPIELYGARDIEETFSAIFDDISDSLEVVPKRNLRHSIDREIAPTIKSVPEIVRELLHSTRSDIRALALEGVGILGHNQSLNLPVLFADTEDLSGLPHYLVLTAIQQRLAAVWVLAEIDPASVGPILPRIMQSYISEQPNHFLIFEYSRRLSEKVLDSLPIKLSTRIASAIQSGWLRITNKASPRKFSLAQIRKLKGPRHINSWPEGFEPGRSPMVPAGILDRDFEWEIERLGAIFRTPATQVEKLIRRFSQKIYKQTEEELAKDRRMQERNYDSGSKRNLSVREDIAKHAYRIVQQRWFTKRIADEKEIQQWGASGIEHRLFDPWLPRLFFGSSRSILDSPPNNIGLEEDQRDWLFEPPAEVQKYLEESDGIIVDQYTQSESEQFRLTCWIDSCLISGSLIDQWLAGDANEPIHRDLPSGIYIKELTDDFSSWWSQYSYGEDEDPEAGIESLYAEGFSERPHDSLRLTVPLGISGSHAKISRDDNGYSIRVSKNLIWKHRSFTSGQYQSIISRRFLLKRLKRQKSSLGSRLMIRKERIAPGKSRWEIAEEVSWTIPVVMERGGEWKFGEAKMDHREYNKQ